MKTPENVRDEFKTTLDHLDSIAAKLRMNSGKGQTFSFPDSHKLSEGIFLSSWTHWEEVTRSLLIIDLATDVNGFLQRDVKKFRLKGAPYNYAEALLNHPDAPQKFVEWDYGVIMARADQYLGAGHRFVSLTRGADLELIKRIRNAVAHKSDRAWNSFKKLARGAPFNLATNQFRGLTAGRFIASHQWNGNFVLEECLAVHRTHIGELVP